MAAKRTRIQQYQKVESASEAFQPNANENRKVCVEAAKALEAMAKRQYEAPELQWQHTAAGKSILEQNNRAQALANRTLMAINPYNIQVK